MNTIAIPAKSKERLQALVQAQQTAQAQIEAIVVTLREALSVPADYVLNNINEGFVPAPEPSEPEALIRP